MYQFRVLENKEIVRGWKGSYLSTRYGVRFHMGIVSGGFSGLWGFIACSFGGLWCFRCGWGLLETWETGEPREAERAWGIWETWELLRPQSVCQEES